MNEYTTPTFGFENEQVYSSVLQLSLNIIPLEEGVNGVNRLATKGEKYHRLPTKREKNYRLPTEKKLTDYRHGPTLSIFVFRKMRSEEHFVLF